MSSTEMFARAPAGLVRDPARLAAAIPPLEAAIASNPKAVDERMALAEARLRMALLSPTPNAALDLLDRARQADPYRAEVYLVHAALLHSTGALDAALKYYDHAALVAPGDARVRFHRAVALLELSRRDADTELADQALDDFELVLKSEPGHRAAMLGAIEAAVYGKAKRLRETLGTLFGRVPCEPAMRAPITRLLYQVVFAFGVGARKNIDQSNKKTMSELVQLVRPWLQAFPGDAGLGGVLAASTAKTDSADELCQRVADYAREIPDVRILRLLLRERLAEVSDPVKRLGLFEGAMQRIPLLDGIAQDFLQLVHLVAKRAVAEGDMAAARAAWERCLSMDADNPSTVHNLLRLSESQGDKEEAGRLHTRLAELTTLYARFSPRADLVLLRAAARLEVELEEELTPLRDALKEAKFPPAARVSQLVRRAVRTHAIARLAVDESRRNAFALEDLRKLLDPGVDDAAVFPLAQALLAAPVSGELPSKYAWFQLAKDAPDEVVKKERERVTESLRKEAEMARSHNQADRHFLAVIERAEVEGRAILEPVSRAGYDLATLPAEWGEVARRYYLAVIQLLQLGSVVDDEQQSAREELYALLAPLRNAMLEPYLPTDINDGAWYNNRLLRLHYGAVLKQGWTHLNKGDADKVVDLTRPHLQQGINCATLQRLYATSVLEDPRLELWSAVEAARSAARAGKVALHWSDPPDAAEELLRIADDPAEKTAQQGASWRAQKLSGVKKYPAALEMLWSAYPGNRGRAMPRSWPSGNAFAPLKPAGMAFYALTVARILRGSLIDWFNTQRPTSVYELNNNRTAGTGLVRVAENWLVFAENSLATERMAAATLEQLRLAINDLFNVLARDRQDLAPR